MLRIKPLVALLSMLLLLASLSFAMPGALVEAFSVQRFGSTRSAIIAANLNRQLDQQHGPTTTILARPKSKWDLLDDDDDDDDNNNSSNNNEAVGAIGKTFESKFPVATDMTYIERNVKRSHENFLSLRNIGGKDVCNDVYASKPITNNKDEEVWYVGKIAKVSDASLPDCIARQWNLIETHATNLRPIELYPHRGNLELWTAPGDTELEVAYNRPELQMTRMEHYEVTPQQLKNNMIGFQGEVYQEGEEGFRTWRKEDGSPARPEINPGGETRPPTEAELEQVRAEMENQ